MTIKRRALRYYGGKWRIAPWIISHFPDHRIYVEVFGGGASVLLRKPQSFCEIYNDRDDEIVNLFSVLRDKTSGNRLCELLRLTPFSRSEFELSRRVSEEPIERARRLIVRSCQGFGSDGVNRRNKTGFRSMGKQSRKRYAHEWANFPESLEFTIDRLQRVSIENMDGLTLIKKYDSPQALFYIDPPYLQSTRNSSGKNYRFEFGVSEHVALSGLLHGMQGKAVISGYQSSLYEDLYADWRRVEKMTTALGRVGAVSRKEVLWMNYEANP